jgi:hypothetical protein
MPFLPPEILTLTPRHREAGPAPTLPLEAGPTLRDVWIFQEKVLIAKISSQEQHRQRFSTCLGDEGSKTLFAIAWPGRLIDNIHT